MENPDRFLIIKPDGLEIAIAEDRTVVVRLKGLEKEAGFAPGLGVMLGLTPTEARRFATALHSAADKAEIGLPRV